jgi:hypothetical protein
MCHVQRSGAEFTETTEVRKRGYAILFGRQIFPRTFQYRSHHKGFEVDIFIMLATVPETVGKFAISEKPYLNSTDQSIKLDLMVAYSKTHRGHLLLLISAIASTTIKRERKRINPFEKNRHF